MAVVVAAAACSGDSGGSAGQETPPTQGGTLRLAGTADIDHLDPVSAFYTPTYKLLRAITRQLVTYPNDGAPAASTAPVPDLATAIPEPTNGGRTYTFTLREGVQWNAPSGPREITADDVARGFKRLCNPSEPTSARDYYQGVIAGMRDYCADFGGVPPEVDAMKKFVESTDIEGIKVLDDRTVEFTLDRPANDFLNILALPSSSPAPAEALDYLPDSPEYRRNFIASGPYTIETYISDKQITLARNPAWAPQTDPVRAAYVDRIEIRLGLNEQQVQNQIQAGAVDMQWDTEVPAIDLSTLQGSGDDRLAINPSGWASHLVLNLQSPNSGKALSKPGVRKAINYAVDKRAVVETLGGPTLQTPASQVLTPTVSGYERTDRYPTLGSAGDPAKAKELLTRSGYGSDITLTMPHREDGKHAAVAQILRQSLAEAGIDLKLVPVDDHLDLLTDYLQDPQAGVEGKWDIALVGWAPAWPGNAARTLFAPLLDGRRCGPGSTNYGCYNNPQLNALLDRAIAAPPAEAAAIWHRADQQVMADAAWAPLVTGSTVNYRSARVAGWVFLPVLQDGDITNVWLVE